MTIIVPGEGGPQDPMVQQAMQAEMQQQQHMQMIQAIQNQLFITAFTQLAIAHASSGEELTLDSGRAIAATANDIRQHYSGFMFEAMGLAKMEKVDNPAEGE